MGELRLAHQVLAESFAGDEEPIPAWEEGDQHLLETLRGCIEVQAFGVMKYPDVGSCTAKLFYSACKLHAFPNGNKRYALVISLLFLIKNSYRMTAPVGLGAATAKWVAESDPHSAEGHPDLIVETLKIFWAENIQPR